ncbi:MAG: IS630 family transposase [Gemmataceae bacterium]|nr:IS630 family transposase [Gemmataceae bacterium]
MRQGLRAADAFTARRCQILLASASGTSPAAIALSLGCTTRTVRNVIHAFGREGLDCLQEKSSRPHSVRPFLDASHTEALKDLLHHSPRSLGKPTSLWTLDLVAEVCHQRGWTPRTLTGEAIRVALKRLKIRWRRARHWITSPDPAYARKKKARDRLIRLAATHPDWVLGYLDETWWSRLAQPSLHAWTADEPLRLVEQTAERTDPDPKALSCYGLLRDDSGQMLLRFVQGRPVSQVTEDYLAWVCTRLAQEGKKALLLVWDNAPWHVSRRVRDWMKAHNRRVKQEGGVRILACYLPIKSPWLNAIEPKWVHGKKAIVEPERLLNAQEIKGRVCEHYRCEQLEPLVQKIETERPRKIRKKVA